MEGDEARSPSEAAHRDGGGRQASSHPPGGHQQQGRHALPLHIQQVSQEKVQLNSSIKTFPRFSPKPPALKPLRTRMPPQASPPRRRTRRSSCRRCSSPSTQQSCPPRPRPATRSSVLPPLQRALPLPPHETRVELPVAGRQSRHAGAQILL